MASSSGTHSVKAQPIGRSRRIVASKEDEEAPAASDVPEEGASQANQVDDEKIAEDIKITTTKLEKLNKADGGLDKWARCFLKDLAADKGRVMAKLEAAKISVVKDRKDYNDRLLALLANSLPPILPDAGLAGASNKPIKPLRITQVTAQGQPLHQQSLLILEEAKALLDSFNELAERDLGASPLDRLHGDFQRDRDYVESLFAAGRKVGKSEIEDMLADRYNEVRGRRQVSKNEEEMGQLVFDNAGRHNGDVTMADSEGWGRVAYKASLAAQKMEDVTRRQ